MTGFAPSTWELDGMRADIEGQLLPDTCNILELTRTSDGQGGWTEAWGTATAGIGVICRLDKMKGAESVIGESLEPFKTWVLSLPHDTTLTEQNRVEHGGNTYTVTMVDDDGSWKLVKRAMLERI